MQQAVYVPVGGNCKGLLLIREAEAEVEAEEAEAVGWPRIWRARVRGVRWARETRGAADARKADDVGRAPLRRGAT